MIYGGIGLVVYHMKSEEVINALSSDFSKGLEESQVLERQQQFGRNKLREKKKKSNLQRFRDQLKDIMILILIVAAAISFAIAWTEQSPESFFEPVLILLIVVVNAVMGVLQESRAERALESLRELSAPRARVLRDGEERIIDASELVPGDRIHLEAGDFVPADARLLRSVNLKSEESALTGESVPVEKDADCLADEKAAIGDRSNMVFSGCSITYGTAEAVVTATGMNTEMGKIADLLNQEEGAQTPLQRKLSQLGKYLGVLAAAACVTVFIVGLMNGIPALEIFMTAVALAVSAIPEGLPAIVTIVLSIGVQRMVKKHAIIRRLPAVETLGSASVICSDKTGTLTENRMTLVSAYADGMTRDEKISVHHSEKVGKLLQFAALCCDGSVVFHGDEEQHIGDPTETAILAAAYKSGMTKEELNEKYPRLGEIPFDSDRKCMTTVHRMNDKNIVIVKGAFDSMKSCCVSGNLEAAQKINDGMSASALRVLAVAYKEADVVPDTLTSQEMENGLTFLGLIGMIDPPRPEVKAAVETCRKAGIRPVMITGDHVVTASAIAAELRILQDGEKAITGKELDALSEEELDAQIQDISVYARVSPENKIRIVKAWQRKNQIVAMTGDGVNDAPALKAADIGCAMGITGTDAAKNAADMILADDNFATIVDAVREGRGIYANIKKVVGFLLGTNIGEVIAVFTTMMLWHQSLFLSMQLLWINLVTDSLPAIALGMENVEAGIMEQRPKPKNEGLFVHGFGLRIALQGVMFGGLALIAFQMGVRTTGTMQGGRTFAFLVLALSQVIQAFNMRSDHSLFKIGVFSNKKLNKAALSSIVLMCLVLFTPLSKAFGLIFLPGKLYLTGVGLIFVPVLLMELTKKLQRI